MPIEPDVAAVVTLRTLDVDLTRESAIVRGFRRRTVPWHESKQWSANSGSTAGSSNSSPKVASP